MSWGNSRPNSEVHQFLTGGGKIHIADCQLKRPTEKRRPDSAVGEWAALRLSIDKRPTSGRYVIQNNSACTIMHMLIGKLKGTMTQSLIDNGHALLFLIIRTGASK